MTGVQRNPSTCAMQPNSPVRSLWCLVIWHCADLLVMRQHGLVHYQDNLYMTSRPPCSSRAVHSGLGGGARADLVPCRTSQWDTIGVSRGVAWCFMGERVKMAQVLWTEVYQKKGEREHKRCQGSWTLDQQQLMGKLVLHSAWAAQLRSPCWWEHSCPPQTQGYNMALPYLPPHLWSVGALEESSPLDLEVQGLHNTGKHMISRKTPNECPVLIR